MYPEERIKLFGMSHALVERDLDGVERSLGIDLQRSAPDKKDEEYYPQFEHELRVEAARMGEQYEVFYCLERSIRRLVADTFAAAHGDNWWNTKVPKTIQDNVRDNIQREIDSGITLR